MYNLIVRGKRIVELVFIQEVFGNLIDFFVNEFGEFGMFCYEIDFDRNDDIM